MKNKKIIIKKKVCIAMSGGVDSSIAASLLKEKGYDCVGVFIKFWTEAETKVQNKCCSIDSYNDARIAANLLGFKLYTLDFRDQFKKRVVNPWLKEHTKGNTPNPCVFCNQFIKFGILLKTMRSLGCNYLATGHYIKKMKKRHNKKIVYELFCSKDKKKDQSYFLYGLKQSQLKHLIFPLGSYLKSEVKAMAKKLSLPVYNKPESQEICFIPEKTHYSFLKRNLRLKAGLIKNMKGKILGSHGGLELYTLGQRQGLNIGGTGPFYVVKINHKNNTLFVSQNHNDELLYSNKFKIGNVNWISGLVPKKTEKISVRIRHQSKPIVCKIIDNCVFLTVTARAIMPGQSAVFYKGQKLLGGGIIKKVL